MLNFPKKHQLIIALLSAATLLVSACSSGSSNSNGGSSNNGDATSLQIITPRTIYSTTTPSSGYITINNTTGSEVKNLTYTIYATAGSGSQASVDEASAKVCNIMPAKSSCNLKINIPAASVAGSFSIKATNDDSLLQKLAQSVTLTPTIALPIGIEQAAYNTIPGADGIMLSYYNTVISGVPYVLVSGVVASSKAGSFNNIVLVDNNGDPIPNQQLTSGTISSTQGSTFAILIPVPATSGASQTIKAQTQQVTTDGKVTVVSTATSSSTLTTTTGVGVANMLPSAVYLSESAPEQVITLSNSGDSAAALQSLISSNPNIEVIFSASSLASGASTTATLKLKDPKAAAANGAITLSYNNGQQEVEVKAETKQNVNPQPSPSPTPTPTPTPTPGPTPTPASEWSVVGGEIPVAISSITFDGSGNLYVGGGRVDGVSGGVAWKYSSLAWSEVGSGGISGSGGIRSIALDSSGNLYAGGYSSSYIGGAWKYSSSAWSEVGGADISGLGGIAIALDGSGNLYAGGPSGGGGEVWQYSGGWTQVGGAAVSGSGDFSSIVFDDNGDIYAGGYNATFNGGGVWKWNGLTWSEVGGADIAGSGNIASVAFDSNGNLYAGGDNLAHNAGGVWKWDGTTWNEVGGADISGSGGLASIALDSSGNLYASGINTNLTAGCVWEWNGSTWSEVGGADIAGSFAIWSIAFDSSGSLYAGGRNSSLTAGVVWKHISLVP
jgi:hypothetical protein